MTHFRSCSLSLSLSLVVTLALHLALLPTMAVGEVLPIAVFGPLVWPEMASTMFMAMLAARHFNERNGSVVPQFASLGNCTIRFNATLVDTQNEDSQTTVRRYISGLDQHGWRAIVGPARSSVSVPIATLGANFETPSISYWSSSATLSNAALFPYFSRTMPSDATLYGLVTSFLQYQGWTRVAMIHSDDPWSVSLAGTVSAECSRIGIELLLLSFSDNNEESLRAALLQARTHTAWQPRIFIAGFFDAVAPMAFTIAHELGLYGAQYHWITTDALSAAVLPAGHVGAEVLDGASRIFTVSNLPDDPMWLRLSDQWAQLRYADLQDATGEARAVAEPVFEQLAAAPLSRDYSGFGYDAVVTLALAACAAGEGASGPELHAQISRTAFVGASGRVAFDEYEDRLPATTKRELQNFRLDRATGELRVETLVGGYGEAGWYLFPGQAFLYHRGNLTAPSDGASSEETRQAAGSGASGSGEERTVTTVVTLVPESGRRLLTVVLATLLPCLLLLALANLSFCAYVRGQQLRSKEAEVVQLVLVSDAGEDLDDELALILARFLVEVGLVRLLAVVANLSPSVDRARLVRGTLDVLGLHFVPVGIGTDGGRRGPGANSFAETAPYLTPNDSPRMRSIESGRTLLHRTLEGAAPKSVTLLLISSLKDAALFMRDNPRLCAGKLKRVVLMGGLDLEASRQTRGLVPDSAHNNAFDARSAVFFLKACSELGVPTTTVSRFAAYRCPMSRQVYDQLAQSGSPIGWRLRKTQRDSIERLWRRACAAEGSELRGDLPARCDRAWFSATFCAGLAAEREEDDPIWDLVQSFNMYDVVALIAAVPVLARSFFKPTALEIGGARHELIGESAASHGILEAGERDLRLLMHRGIGRGIGLEKEARWRESVLLVLHDSRLEPASLAAHAAQPGLLAELGVLACVAIVVVRPLRRIGAAQRAQSEEEGSTTG